MAYVQTVNDPAVQEQTQNPGGMNQPAPQTSGTATGSGGATGSGVASVPNATKAPPVQDLKAYLAANADQAVGMGQHIAGDINQAGTNTLTDMVGFGNQFENTVANQDVAPNADLVNQAATDPTAFVQNPTNVSDFLAQENAAYTGPQNFESTDEYTNANAAVQKELANLPDINKAGGVQQLVTSQETNPTAGMSNLDTLLLQENPDAMKPIQEAIPNVQNSLNTNMTGMTQFENQAIQKAISDDAASQAGVQDKFLTGSNAVVPAFQQGVQGELNANIGQVNAYNKALQDLITQENSAQVPLSTLRTDVADFMKNYGDTKNPYYGIPGLPNITSPYLFNNYNIGELPTNPTAMSQPTLAQSATPADIAKQNALEELLGSGYTPSFDATGQTQFKTPGTMPSLKSEIQDILSKSNLPTFTPIPANYNATGRSGWELGMNKLNNDYQSLQKYLEGLS